VSQAFDHRVRAIRWSEYEASCGNSPQSIPDLLIEMAGPDRAHTVPAAERLWNLLCHQHNTAPVDVPALPFLLEILDNAPDDLAVEILDMLFGFAATTGWHRRHPGYVEPHWVTELRAGLAAELPRFRRLAESTNDDVAAFAEGIVEEVEAKLVAWPVDEPPANPPLQRTGGNSDSDS
jgi:hypothetical protein